MASPVGLLKIAPSVYLPALLYDIGQGAIAPIVALSARDLGAAVATAGLTAVALLMGIGNGLGAGVIMTLGADASPPVGRAQFLGAFRLFADTGNGAGPLLIAAVTALAGLAPAVLVMGLTGWAAATAMSRWIPPHPTRPD